MDEPELTDQPIWRTLSTEKRRILFVFTPLVLFAIMLSGNLINLVFSHAIDLIGTLALNILAFAWIRADRTERDYDLHRHFSFAVVIFGTLALVYYLFRSRGFVDGLRSLGWLVLYIVSCTVATGIATGIIMMALIMSGLISPTILDQ